MASYRLLSRKVSRLTAFASSAALAVLGLSTPSQAAPPPHPASHNTHLGAVAESHPLGAEDMIAGAARGWKVRYLTSGLNDTPLWSNGIILEPFGAAPKGGYKIVTYAHGAKGEAGHCQPTAAHLFRKDAEYVNIAALLKKGYAVTLTDYPLINDVQPFMDWYSEGTSVLDIVRAAHHIDPALSKDITIGGYSIGGQAALAAASLQPTYAPEFNNHGLFPIAAPFGQETLVHEMGPESKNDMLGFSDVVALLLAGFRVSEPKIAAHADEFITPKGMQIINDAATHCMGDTWLIGAALTRPGELFRKSVASNPTVEAAVKNYMRTPTSNINGPVYIIQGASDQIVNKDMTNGLEASLHAHGTRNVTVHYYRGEDHISISGHCTQGVVNFVSHVMPSGVTPTPAPHDHH